MKKILALILAMCISVSVGQIAVFSNDNNVMQYDESWSLFKALNIISFDDEEKTDIITRGEFASVLAEALRLLPSEQSMNAVPSFGKPENAEKFTDETNVQMLFSDVSDTNPYYEAIKVISTYKIMTGNGNNSFNPDAALKYEEAIKTFVLLCGYESRAMIDGGWFSGYEKVARRINILLDNKNIGQQLTKAELVEIFYKVLDVEINDVRGVSGDVIYYESKKSGTFIAEYMNIGCVEGQVTAVENSTLTAPLASLNENIVVDGQTVRNQNGIRTNEYLGRTVKAYYSLNDDMDTLLYIALSKNDKAFTIQAESLGGYSDGVLTYFSGNSVKHYNIKNLPVIYNGTAKVTFTEDIFNFQFGDVTITKNGENDVVIIHDYRDMIISAVSASEKTLYGGADGKSLLLDENYSMINIYNSGGEKIDFSALEADMPITYLDGENYKEIRVCPAAKSGVIKSFDAEPSKIVFDDSEYLLADSIDKNEINGYVGKTVKIYVNIFNAVFKIEVSENGIEKFGCLVGVADAEAFSGCKARIFTSEGKMSDYSFADKVTVYNGNSVEAAKMSGDNVKQTGALGNYKGFVTYKTNNDNEITMMQIPLENRSLKKDGDGRMWTKKVESSSKRTNLYSATTNSIGTQIYFDNSVKIFSVPESGAQEDYRILNFNSFPTLSDFGVVLGFYSDFADPIPEAVVINNWVPENAVMTMPSNLSVIIDIEEGVNEDGEPRKTATVVDSTGVKSVIYSDEVSIDSDGNKCTAFDAAWVDMEKEKRKADVGDIISYTASYGKTQEVISVTLIFDCSIENMPGGKKGYLAQAVPGSDLYYTTLDIETIWAKNTDCYTVSEMIAPLYNVTGTLKKQNPVRFEPNAEAVFKNDGHRDYNGGRKFMLGYVADKTDAFVYLTTQDLSLNGAEFDVDGIPDTQIPCPDAGTDFGKYYGIYWQEWFKFVNLNGYILTVEYYDDGVEVRKGVPGDIYSYNDAKNEASRVLADPGAKRYYVINDHRTK